MNHGNKMLRNLPAVETILNAPGCKALLKERPRWLILDSIHSVLEQIRQEILGGESVSDQAITVEGLLPKIIDTVEKLQRFRLRPVINATGVVIHTNLGRSLLSPGTMAHVAEVSSHYSNLEYDLAAGRRGTRYSHVEEILCRLCGSEAALVVNNNAGAVLLGLNTLSEGKEVVVSRGQLVEIGGSFRIPDVIRKSGCILVEVGTTNKTHPKDYRNAINAQTACLLKVHMSNFEMRGFTREVTRKELVEIARESGQPLMEDLGSGSLIDLSEYGLRKEPTVQESLQEGVDLVTFSGDKLLGGPQAGILVGKKEILDRVKKNPLTRALRVDKMTLSALEITLRELMDPDEALKRVPTLRMLTFSLEELKARAVQLSEVIRKRTGDALEVNVMEDISQVGGGALPENPLPTFVVSLGSPAISVNALEKSFRFADPPVIGRIQKDRFFLDVRTVLDHEFEMIAGAAERAIELKGKKDSTG
jgi:L-seryl-tRNA(Ser) seleniumtransferase